jgi:hypothetical protein
MASQRSHLFIASCAVLIGLAACGSDDESGSDTSIAVTAVAESSAPPVSSEAPVTIEPSVATDAPETSAADTTDASETTTDESAGDDTAVDDAPVCRAFSRAVTTSFFVGFAGSGAGDENTGVERVEVVAYSSLTADAATLRAAVPANLLPGLEPLLERIDAAPVALAEGGFDAAEITTIASAWNSVLDAVAAGNSLDDIPDATAALDQTTLDAAEIAFEAAVGTFAEYQAASESNPELDDLGNAWLAENCPILASSLNS